MIMKKALTILIAILSLTACDKVYINGDLDGMWQLQQVEKEGNIEYPEGIYYSFQRHMAQVGKYYENAEQLPKRYLGEMDYSGNILIVYNFREFGKEENVATTEILQEYFLYDTLTQFSIERLDEDFLIMKSDRATYTLEKW